MDEEKINEERGAVAGGGEQPPLLFWNYLWGFYTEHLRPAASVSH